MSDEPTIGSVLAEKRIGPVKYRILFPKEEVLAGDFPRLLRNLEKTLDLPLWLLIQDGDGTSGHDFLGTEVRDIFFAERDKLSVNKPIALLIDSHGGDAAAAYQLATFLRRRCGGFVAVIPRYGKSAATLLTLGADKVILGREAELGPLDAQLLDPEREEFTSALDEVQSLERLHAFALEALDRTMLLLMTRTQKRIETLTPLAMRFITDMTCPLFEKIDTVHYTQRSRQLKVAEAYAVRLLKRHFPETRATHIARHLVEQYPEHGFVIDEDEFNEIGLGKLNQKPNKEQADIIDELVPFLGKKTLIGYLKEGEADEKRE